MDWLKLFVLASFGLIALLIFSIFQAFGMLPGFIFTAMVALFAILFSPSH